MTNLTNKIALVTGASGGLGTHVTKALLDAGFTVVGLAPRIQQSAFDHPNFVALPSTLGNLDAAKKAVDTVVARSGKIDVSAHAGAPFSKTVLRPFLTLASIHSGGVLKVRKPRRSLFRGLSL